MNANPFTEGHRYLIGQAASQVDNLYVIVVKEDRSRFPYSERKAMIEAGCAGLDNVISFAKEDCMALSFADNSFDAVTAAFGIRNFEDLDRGLAEIHRVLKPGGHLSIVELTTPVTFPMRQLFKIYSNTVLPLYGRMISKDSSAYEYLTRTIEAFPQGEVMMDIFKKAGFAKTSFRRLTFGICTMYLAEK